MGEPPTTERAGAVEGVRGGINPSPRGLGLGFYLDLWICLLNYMHAGPRVSVCDWLPSAAQKRVHSGLLERARTFVREGNRLVLCGKDIRSYIRMNSLAYSGKPSAIPLGANAGIPDAAACVDTAAVLGLSLIHISEPTRPY